LAFAFVISESFNAFTLLSFFVVLFVLFANVNTITIDIFFTMSAIIAVASDLAVVVRVETITKRTYTSSTVVITGRRTFFFFFVMMVLD